MQSNATLSSGAGQRTLPRVIHRCQTWCSASGPDNESTACRATYLPANRGQALSLIITDDCSWEKQAQAAVQQRSGCIPLMEACPQEPHLDTATKLHTIGTFIKPCITYGMEVWAPTDCNEPSNACATRKPIRLAIRAALGISSGHLRRLYATDLLHGRWHSQPALRQ
jgi:hypothetical protein